MNFNKFVRTLAPIAAIAIAAGAAGCKDMNIRMGDADGVPLAELDTSGDAPEKLTLAGPDTVVVTDGDTLAITVEGDTKAKEALRFVLKNGSLGISRESEDWNKDDGQATIRVTMPAPREIVIAGSGGVAAQSMAADAKAVIAGSGRLDVAALKATKLDVNVMGSGTFATAGKADEMDLTIAGSGDMEASGLEVSRAKISVMGSGAADFASNGTVDAKIMGSGNVTVTGNATCTVNSMGSGTVTCRATAPKQAAKKTSKKKKKG